MHASLERASCLIFQLTPLGSSKVPFSIMFGSLVSAMVQREYFYTVNAVLNWSVVPFLAQKEL